MITRASAVITGTNNLHCIRYAMLPFFLLVALLQWHSPAAALATEGAHTESTRTIVISGLGGNAEYDEKFTRFGTTIAEHARQLTDDDADVVLLQGKQATKKAILDTLANLTQIDDDYSVRLFLLGHGSFDGSEYKYNIPGPDLTGSELIESLNQLPQDSQLVVVSTSASGAVFEPLAASQRVVITATKNGRERNAVKFTEHLVNGLGDPSADTNKDETISANELYQYAERAVAQHYEDEKLLASEHSRISGDSAETLELARYGTLLANQAEISRDLIVERNEISARITSLRNRKADLAEDDYFDRLQSLMLELASVQRAIDEPAGTVHQPSSDNAGPEVATDEVTPNVD